MEKILLGYDILFDLLSTDGEKDDILFLQTWLKRIGAIQYVSDITRLLLYEKGFSKNCGFTPISNCKNIYLENISLELKERQKIWSNIIIETKKPLYLKDTEQDTIFQLLKLSAYFQELNALKLNNIDYIISDDIFMNRIAFDLGLHWKVYTVESFIERCCIDYPELNPEKGSHILYSGFKDIDVRQPFFDSYRQEYSDFDQWFNRKSIENDKAYITLCNTQVTAFLYLKLENINENYSDITPPFLPKLRLKIGSFKVLMNGYKTGESFFKIIFDQAIHLHVDEIYVTIFKRFETRRRLINRLERWGFTHWGYKNNMELVFVRNFKKKENKDYMKCFPFHARSQYSYIIPLQSFYEQALFHQNIEGKNIDENANPIRKVLIIHKYLKNMERGSILLFYSIKSRKFISVGIIENLIEGLKNRTDFISACKKRSIFPNEQLINCWNYNKKRDLVVIKFLNSYTLPETDQIKMKIPCLEKRMAPQIPIELTLLQYNDLIKDTQYEKNIVVN